MKKRGFMVLVAVAIVPVCLMFLTSCAKEAFKETPGAPSFEEERAALPEERLAPGEEAMAGAVQEEGKLEFKPEEPTEEEKLAALREQALREQEELERRERERLERELREQQEAAMRQREEMAREVPPETEVARLEAERRLVQLREEFESVPIYFAFDSAVLTDPAKDVLRQKAAFMIENRNAGVMIEGHCDERGSVEYNLALGQRRAESAQRYLVLLGVELSRTRTISYGNERPVDPRHDEEAWAKNRRCEFVLEPR